MEQAILWWIVFAIIGGAIGAMKGRVGPGILLGVLLGPLGILFSLGLTSQKDLDKKSTRKCPYCAERIQKKAKVCKHCHKSVESLICPSCQARLMKPDAARGTVFKCPSCAASVRLP